MLARNLEACSALQRPRETCLAISLITMGALILDWSRWVFAPIAQGAWELNFFESPMMAARRILGVTISLGFLWQFQWLVE